MDQEQEIWRLAGEAMAAQSILVGLCMGLAASSDLGGAIVENAFSYAETVAEAGALKLGGAQPEAHLKAFMGVVEQLREATIGGNGEPKSGV